MAQRGTSSKPVPRSSRAVMASRREPPASLDFFPTPPWATRALCEHVFAGQPLSDLTCWEPAAGRGHMAAPLGEYFRHVHASDVFDYGCGHPVGSFTGAGLDVADCPFRPDIIATNPPFNEAEAFVQRALVEARIGVAMLVRTAWLESRGRYESLFAQTPPSVVALFVERVPMVKGRWDPEASTATSYAWVVWWQTLRQVPTRLVWIPPGCRETLTRPDDRRRFAPESMPAGFADTNPQLI